MKPILFASNATTYTTNGIGRLECISCEVVEERNGIYELELTIAETALHADQIAMDSIIVAKPNNSSSNQAFRVYEITKPINGQFTVSAQHITYQLSYIPAMPFTVLASSSACNSTLAGLKSHAAEYCPFTFWTDVTTVASYTQTTPASIRSRLGGSEGSVLDNFGGEYEWDNWTVKLHKNRGVTTPTVSLIYGKNITDIEQDKNLNSTVTGVCPFWVSSDGTSRVTLPEEVIESQYASQYPFHRTVPLDLSSEYEEAPTAEQMRADANAYLNRSGVGLPADNLKVSFIELADTEEYKNVAPLQAVNLCDYINVVFPRFGITATAKVVKTKYDVLREKYNEIEIGSTGKTLASTISDTNGAIATTLSKSLFAVKNATAWLTSSGGYVIAIKNADGSWKELCFASSIDLHASSTNVLRVNENGLGFSSTGIDGPYTQAWTLDGRMVIGGTNVPSLTVYQNGGSSGNIIFQISKDGMQWSAANSSMTQSGVLTLYAGAINLGAISGGGYNFTVNNSGVVAIKKGSIQLGWDANNSRYNFTVTDAGALTAYSGTFSGNVTGAAIRGGSIGIGGSNYDNFAVDSNGAVTIKSGSISINNDAFKVTDQGVVTIKNGSITLGNSAGNDYFNVTAAGVLTAYSGTFKGTLNGGAVSGSTITGGSIGIGGGNNDQFVVDSSGNVTIKSGSITIGNSGGNDYFNVNSSGQLTAYSGTFKGNVTGAAIRGGSIGIGGSNNDNFQVASDGTITIKKGSINLGNVFTVDNNGVVKSIGDNTNGTTTISGGRIENGSTKIWKGYIQTWYLGITDENGNVQGAWTAHYNDTHVLWTGAGINVGSEYGTASVFNTNVTVVGTIYADGFQPRSDRRLKKNIDDLKTENAQKFIMGLKPKSFRFKKRDDDVHHGFIAQDVEEIAEWDVVSDDEDGYKGIKYHEIIADLVAVIQDQERRIAELERRLNDKP